VSNDQLKQTLQIEAEKACRHARLVSAKPTGPTQPTNSQSGARHIPFHERPYCSVKEASQATGLSRSRLYELFDEGLDSVKVGKRRLVSVPSLLHLLKSHETSSDRGA
jgi:hypothetical protein